jgi:magnesium-transporting ATPase (P-type)
VLLCSDRLSVQRDKAHILFGGTRIMQHDGDKAARIRTPDNGCLAVVLRTGFDTSQGEVLLANRKTTPRCRPCTAGTCLLVVSELQ